MFTIIKNKIQGATLAFSPLTPSSQGFNQKKSVWPPGSLTLVPLLKIPAPVLKRYFQNLIRCNLLKFRMSPLVNPQWEDVLSMIRVFGQNMYCVINKSIYPPEIVGEFMLENFSGKSAQAHFSANPKYSNPRKYSTAITWASSQVLNEWKVKGKDEPYLKTLIGFIPVSNRPAIFTLMRAKWKKQVVVPQAILHLGKVEDAVLLTCTREDL